MDLKILEVDSHEGRRTFKLLDSHLNQYKTLAENLILLANGSVTYSLVSMLTVKKLYSKEDHVN